MNTRTTPTQTDVVVGVANVEVHLMTENMSKVPSPDAASLVVARAYASNNMAWHYSGRISSDVVGDEDDIVSSFKGYYSGVQERGTRVQGQEIYLEDREFRPNLVGGAMEGLWEAATTHGDGIAIVGGPCPAKGASKSIAPSPKQTWKPPQSPPKVTTQGIDLEDASTKVRCMYSEEPLSAYQVHERSKLLICIVHGTLIGVERF